MSPVASEAGMLYVLPSTSILEKIWAKAQPDTYGPGHQERRKNPLFTPFFLQESKGKSILSVEEQQLKLKKTMCNGLSGDLSG